MKKVCVLVLLLTALTSCVKDVILDANEEFLAVYCVLKVDSVQELKLSYTKSVTMAKAPRVTEATAVLTDLTEGREAGRFIQINDSLWRLDYAAIPTHNYRLEITVPDRDLVWAEQTMPAEPPVESERKVSHVVYRVHDLILERDVAYEGYSYRFTSPCTIWICAESYDKSSALSSEPWKEVWVPVKELCTDHPYVDDFNLTGKVWERYKDDSIDPYAQYIADLSGYNMHRDVLRIPKDEEQTQCYFSIDGNINNVGIMGSKSFISYSYVYFSAPSDDYDLYLLDAYQQYYAELSHALSSIYLRDNMYSNIHGGIGIFGAATTIRVKRQYSWPLGR